MAETSNPRALIEELVGYVGVISGDKIAFSRVLQKIERDLQEIERLRAENKRLRSVLDLWGLHADPGDATNAAKRDAVETSGELEQLRRIDQAARAFVNALPEDMTFRGAQRKFAALCDALFDQIPQREGDNRDVSAERCRNAATVPETSGSYSYSDPSADARTPAGAGIASPPVYRPPLDEFLVCGQFETDPRSAFCLKCGYPRRDHRGAVKAAGEPPKENQQ